MTGRPSRTRSVIALGVFLTISFAAAGVGSLAQGGDVAATYAALERPPWAPPAWLFGPVWTVLYALIGVAAWRVWLVCEPRTARPALTLWVAQLIVNAAWPGAFFGLGELGLALAVILVLDLLVLGLVGVFVVRDRLATLLIAPYLAWILFATALNTSILARA